jgi:hypothetical protein
MILGRTLGFWSGVLAALAFLGYLLTCRLCTNSKLACNLHRYMQIAAIILVVLHIYFVNFG